MRSINAVVTIAMCFLVISVLAVGCRTGGRAVVSTDPANGATAVATNRQRIRVTFGQPMDRKSVEDAFSISPAVGAEKPSFNWSNDGQVVVANLPQPLQPNTAYTVSLKPGARAYNQMDVLREPARFSFTTGPTAVAGATAGPSTGTIAGETPPAVASAPSADASSDAAPASSFAKDIQPIAASVCDTCHASRDTGKMSDLDNILKKKYVIPGDPDNSPYYKKASGFVSHGGGDAWKANKELVHNWIAQGAAK
jgi:hypothetical protein